jgi:sialate O-acetylesterase
MRRLSTVLFLAAFCTFTAFAAVKPAGVFTDYTVLQQNEPVRIWGTATPGEKVTVQFAGQEKNTVASDRGEWQVTLDPMPASSEPRTLCFVSSIGNHKSAIGNVLVGEVWLAGGQSNMASTMNTYKKTTQKDIDSANDPLLRMITIPGKVFAEQKTATPSWQATTPQNVTAFSASAYYFAKNLRETLKVPVGIVACSVGGTPAEAWMSRKTLESSPDLKRILDAYETTYRKNFADDTAYLKKLEETKAAAKKAGRKPAALMGPQNAQRPCGLHENMLTQTIPYTIKGVIWYQGENNANTRSGFHYRTVFPALIKEWREEFQNKKLPFLFVQLASFGPAADVSSLWPELRESQSWTEENVKNTGMIVLTDGGEVDNIHPHSKDKVGYRLSLLARNMVYGEKKLVCHGPRLKDADRKDGAIELSFKDTGSGLVLKSEPVSAFEICGKDGKFVPAKAELVKGKIIVSSEIVKDPQEVRYSWKKWVVPTLFNAEGLPASPFRTDDFPPETKDRFYLDGK